MHVLERKRMVLTAGRAVTSLLDAVHEEFHGAVWVEYLLIARCTQSEDRLRSKVRGRKRRTALPVATS